LMVQNRNHARVCRSGFKRASKSIRTRPDHLLVIQMETRTLKPPSEKSAPKASSLFKKILVAVDGSESATRAANAALELADKLKADLIILHAVSPPSTVYKTGLPSMASMAPPPPSQSEIDEYYAYAKRVATGIMSGTISEAKRRGVKVKSEIVEGVASTVETIINHASKENVDMIVVGTRGLGGFRKLLIGSVSSAVVTHASCPVLIVR
jgi:nucleotide-binding universal stress UspA family protein